MSWEQEDSLRRKVREARERQAFRADIQSVLSTKEAQDALLARRDAEHGRVRQERVDRDQQRHKRMVGELRRIVRGPFGMYATAVRRKSVSMVGVNNDAEHDIRRTVVNNLRVAREHARLSQGELCEKANIAQAYLILICLEVREHSNYSPISLNSTVCTMLNYENIGMMMSSSVLLEMKPWMDRSLDQLLDSALIARELIKEFGDIAILRAGAIGAEHFAEGNLERFELWKKIVESIRCLEELGWIEGTRLH